MTVAIIGGGISGLATAYELSRRRIPFHLFEGSDRLGGLVRTEHVEGYTIETGADSMLSTKPGGMRLCEELGLSDRLLSMNSPRTAFVFHAGRLRPLPSPAVLGIPASGRLLATHPLLDPVARARLAIEPLVPRRADAADESVASFYRRRFGRATVPVLAQPLVGGIHAGDVETLSARAVLSRFVDVEASGESILRWARRTITGTDSGAFRTLTSGMGELVEAIRRRLPESAVRCSTPIRAARRMDAAWRLEGPATDDRYEALVFACPGHVVARLLGSVNKTAGDICKAIPYVSTVSVAMSWPRSAVDHPLAGSGFVVARASSRLRITACTWVTSKWPSRAPEGRVLLRAYIGGAHDPTAIDLGDRALGDLAVLEVSAILSINGPPVLVRVHRWRDAGAQHMVGHLDRISELERQLVATPGLFVTGSGFRAVGIPDCIADGRSTAAAVESYIHGQ